MTCPEPCQKCQEATTARVLGDILVLVAVAIVAVSLARLIFG